MKAYFAENYPGPANYLGGFMLALLLTVLAFGLACAGSGIYLQPVDWILDLFPRGQETIGAMPKWLVFGAVFLLAVLQVAVHFRYFLHLGFGSRQRLNVLAILFSLFIILIIVCGTLWIIHDLNTQMSPASPGDGL